MEQAGEITLRKQTLMEQEALHGIELESNEAAEQCNIVIEDVFVQFFSSILGVGCT